MNLFAVVESGAIEGEVFGRGGTPFAGAKVTAYGPDGQRLGETKTDNSGEFSLIPTKRCDWRLVAITEDGHQAEYVVPAAELPSNLPDGGNAPSESPKPPAEAQTATAMAAESRTAASATPTDGVVELDRQLAALRREVNALRNELRWQDIIGGLGYILGLMGLTFYFFGVQKRARDPVRSGSDSEGAMSAETADSRDPAKLDT